MELEDVMRNLQAELRLPALTHDTEGVYAIRFDTVNVAFAPGLDPQTFEVRARLGRIDVDDTALVEAMMVDNLRSPWSGSAALGIDLQGSVFLVGCHVKADFCFPSFLDSLSRFVSRAEAWQARLCNQPALAC